MADAKSVVELVFQGRDKTAEAVNAALGNAERFSKGVQNISGPLADTGKAALKFEAAILAAGTAIVGFSINAASQFHTAALSLQKVLVDTDPTLEVFTNRAKELAFEYGVASIDVLNSITNFKKAGFEAAETFDLTATALAAVIAGEVELSSASDRLVAALKGFGAEASEAAGLVDLLNFAANNYAVTFDELLTGFAEFSPVAKAANLSFEETAGILVPVVEVFRSGSEAGTALKTSLLRLQQDAPRTTDALAELGVAQRDANGELKSAGELYFEVAQALQNVDGNQKSYLAAQLVGINQSAKFLAATDGLAKTLVIAGDDFNYLGSAAKEVEVVMGSAEKQIDRVGIALRGVFTAIGTPLLEEFGDISTAITSIFGAITDSVGDEDQLGGIVKVVEQIMAEAAAALGQAAQSFPDALGLVDWGSFERGLRTITDQINQLFRTWDLTTPEGLARIMEGLGIVFERLSTITAGILSSFKFLFDAMGSANPEILKFGQGFDDAIGKMLGLSIQIDAIMGGVDRLISMLTILAGVLTVKSGVSLAGSLGIATGALTKFALPLAASAGIWKIAELTLLLGEWAGAAREAAAAQELATKTINKSEGELQKVATELGIVVESYDDFWKLVRDGVVVADEASGKWVLATEKQVKAINDVERDYEAYVDKIVNESQTASGAQDQLTEAMAKIGLVWDENLQAFRSGKDAIDDIAQSTETAEESSGRWIKTIVDGIPTFTQAGEAATKGFNDATAAIDEAAGRSENFLAKMEEIASNERIKLIEIKAELNAAEIEAETARIEKAFESLNEGIKSTGNVMSELMKEFVGFDGSLLSEQAQLLKEAIYNEQRFREKQFELQEQLTRAQIAQLQAKTEALNRGDAMIKVDGDGLAPHLEAFMWEILRVIQVRVNQDGLEMLTGVT